MNRAEFEADLIREGYEVREGSLEPNLQREAHARAFDARILAAAETFGLFQGYIGGVRVEAVPQGDRQTPWPSRSFGCQMVY